MSTEESTDGTPGDPLPVNEGVFTDDVEEDDEVIK